MFVLQYCYEPRHSAYYVERVFKIEDEYKEAFIYDQWIMGCWGCQLSDGKGIVFYSPSDFQYNESKYKEHLLKSNTLYLQEYNEKWVKLVFKKVCPKHIEGYRGITDEFEIINWKPN